MHVAGNHTEFMQTHTESKPTIVVSTTNKKITEEEQTETNFDGFVSETDPTAM